MKVFDGDVESLVGRRERRASGVRVVVDGRQGFAWAGSLDADVVADALAEARDNAAFATPDECARAWRRPTTSARTGRRRSTCGATTLAQVDHRGKVALALEAEAATPRCRRAGPRRRVGDRTATPRPRPRSRTRTGVEAAARAHDVLVRRVRARRRGRRDPDRLRLLGRARRSPTSTSTPPRATRPSARSGCSARPSPQSRRLPVVLDPLVTRSLLAVLGGALERRGDR